MVNVSLLKGKIVEKGYNQKSFAQAAKIDASTLSRKLKTGELFSVGEANKIVKTLNLTDEDIIAIFFVSQVS